MELLPSILELQQEYEPLGIEFLYLSLDVDSPSEALTLMKELEGPPFYRLTAPLERATELLVIHEPPAILGYTAGGGEPFRLEPGTNGALVSPEDAATLLEGLLAQDL